MGEERNWPLFEYAFCPRFSEELLPRLAYEAAPETWSLPSQDASQPFFILYYYIHCTFKRLKEQYDAAPTAKERDAAIFECGEHACFDTGLFTANYEALYGYFVANRIANQQKWFLRGFYKESDPCLNRFFPLPARAQYLRNTVDIVYDYRLEWRINVDHIIDHPENIKRLPARFQSPENRVLASNAFKGAVVTAKKRLLANYRLAVPQYYEGSVQLLVPICLEDESRADVSLVIYRQDNIYQGRTCLSLDMAYNNARLLAKPESDWLSGLTMRAI